MTKAHIKYWNKNWKYKNLSEFKMLTNTKLAYKLDQYVWLKVVYKYI